MVAALLLLLVAAPPQDPPRSAAERMAARVEIVRTEYGVPHIVAEDLEAMGFALGYVQSEDYGASIAVGMVATRGALARHLGPDFVEDDVAGRERHAVAQAGFPQLDADTRAVYRGFAEGVNDYVRLHPGEFPPWVRPDFTGVDALDRDVQVWSRSDAARFVRTMAANGGPGADEEEEPDTRAYLLDGSNAWAFHGSRTRSGHTILLRNPHLSWGDPDSLLLRPSGLTYYEAHVRVPGVIDFYGDFRIGTAFGIIGGFNPRLGWATTNNYPRYSQVYALAVHPTLEDHAVLDGEPIPLEARVTTVEVLSPDGGTTTEKVTTWWTEFGPVIHRDDERVYVLKDPRHGIFRRGEQFLRMMRAENLEEWLEVMRMRAHPSSNFTYADADGNIAHYYNARLPLLPHPPTGDTAFFARSRSQIWWELVPWDDLPLYLNPPGGYVQQANDTPDYTNLNVPLDRDTVAPNLPEPRLRLRSQLSLQLVHGADTVDAAEVIRRKHTPRMLLAERVLDELLDALEADPAMAHARDVLARWDRTASTGSRGAVLFKSWAERYFGGADTVGLWAEPWSPERPTETPRGLGRPERARRAMAEAVRLMEARGLALDVPWGEVHRVIRGEVDEPAFGCEPTLGCFRALSFQAAPDGRLRASRGDAWVLVVEFGERPRAYTVLAYGQTARRDSPHFDDQAAMFARGRLKSIAWTAEEIDAGAIRRYRPGREVRR